MTDENTPKDLREALDRANERVAQAEEAAKTATAELRTFQAQVTFERNGLTAKHADLFLAANPEAEVTPDAITSFAEEYGLVPAGDPDGSSSDDGGSASDEPTETAGLAGLGRAAGGTSGAAPAAQPKLSREEFDKLLETDPAAAAKAYVDGTAPRNSRNTTAQHLVDQGIIDH